MAWMLCKKPYTVPIPGTRKPERLAENQRATDVILPAIDPNAFKDAADSVQVICTSRYAALAACCAGVQNIVLIGNEAFSGQSGLTGILRIPDTVMEIGEYCFQFCGGLTGIKLPENLKLIGQGAFKLCGSLTGTRYIPESKKVKITAKATDGSNIIDLQIKEAEVLLRF